MQNFGRIHFLQKMRVPSERWAHLISCVDTVMWKLSFAEKSKKYDGDRYVVHYSKAGRTFCLKQTLVWTQTGCKSCRFGFHAGATSGGEVESPWMLVLYEFGDKLRCTTGDGRVMEPVQWFWQLIMFLTGSRKAEFEYLADEISSEQEPTGMARKPTPVAIEEKKKSQSPPARIGWVMDNGKRVWKSPALSCIDKVDYTRNELHALFSAEDLAAYCRLKTLSETGPKKTLVKRILDFRKTGKAVTRNKKRPSASLNKT